MTAPASPSPQAGEAPGSSPAREPKLKKRNYGLAIASGILLLVGGFVGFRGIVDIAASGSRNSFSGTILFGIVLLAISLICCIFSVTIGSTHTQNDNNWLYNITVAAGFLSPLGLAALAVVATDNLNTVRSTATLIAVALFVEVVINSMLKSDVKGPRREALQFSGIIVGLAAAAWVVVGAFTAPS